jgi:hypothetical protein
MKKSGFTNTRNKKLTSYPVIRRPIHRSASILSASNFRQYFMIIDGNLNRLQDCSAGHIRTSDAATYQRRIA